MPTSSPRYWLIKSEPFKYSFDQLVRDGKTVWDGIRNFEARNNLRAMKKGDLCLFYHSNEGKAVVGIAEVAREAFHDPTTEEDFSAVEVTPQRSLPRAVGLDEMRADPLLGQMMIFRRQRLSVVPVTKNEFDEIVARSGRPAPAEGAPASTRASAKKAPKQTPAAKAARAASAPRKTGKTGKTAAKSLTPVKKSQSPKRPRSRPMSHSSKRER